jgi:hypothetical protein
MDRAAEARVQHLENKKKWWIGRDRATMVPKDIATQKIGDISGEIPRVRQVQSFWALPLHMLPGVLDPKHIITLEDNEDFIPLTAQQTTYNSTSSKWRLTTTKCPGMLDASGPARRGSPGSRNSANTSGV